MGGQRKIVGLQPEYRFVFQLLMPRKGGMEEFYYSYIMSIFPLFYDLGICGKIYSSF
jgi:hypothetical protein